MRESTFNYLCGAGLSLVVFGLPLGLKNMKASNKLNILEKDRANFPVNMNSLTRAGPDYYKAVIDYGNGNVVTNYLGKVENSNLVERVEDGK
jgi:hypothetical protein